MEEHYNEEEFYIIDKEMHSDVKVEDQTEVQEDTEELAKEEPVKEEPAEEKNVDIGKEECIEECVEDCVEKCIKDCVEKCETTVESANTVESVTTVENVEESLIAQVDSIIIEEDIEDKYTEEKEEETEEDKSSIKYKFLKFMKNLFKK
jgi:hypothetical protein